MRWGALGVGLLVLVLPSHAEAGGPKAQLIDDRWRHFGADSTVTVDHDAWAWFLGLYLVRGGDGINRIRYGAVTPADKAVLKAMMQSSIR